MLCLATLLVGVALFSSSQALGADAGLTRVEQTDTRLSYAGSWSTFSTASASGGSYKRANTNGSSVTVKFDGTYLAWIATKGTTLGKAFVSLDGGAPTSVNLAASAVAYQQRVWNTGTLSSGTHTVKIWRDPASLTGKYISVDAVEVVGTLIQPIVQPPTATGATRYQQTDTRLLYAGSWSTFSTASASGGSYKRANTNGSSVTVKFDGTYLAWIATKGTTLGKALVSVDGGAPTSVNLAASAVAYQQRVWNTGTLSSGTHTVKIWRDPASLTGKYISVDAVEVVGNLVAPPAPAYYVDATNGSDSNNGLSPTSAWRTLAKVRSRTYGAGDQILLKRGETWREQLRSCMAPGHRGRPITVGAYGTGAKPLILGSLNRSSTSNWTETSSGSHIWWTTCWHQGHRQHRVQRRHLCRPEAFQVRRPP